MDVRDTMHGAHCCPPPF